MNHFIVLNVGNDLVIETHGGTRLWQIVRVVSNKFDLQEMDGDEHWLVPIADLPRLVEDGTITFGGRDA